MTKLAVAQLGQWGWLITLVVLFFALPWLGPPAGWWFANFAFPDMVTAMKIEPLEHAEAFKAGMYAAISLLGGAACMGVTVWFLLICLRVFIQRKKRDICLGP
ncbi:hypothetical protein [Nitrospirillum amazonense]|uniref:hypothetical protein n=1 Tax=Nitrospirillum amazonense TaxID=28077 RepID=UPI0024127BFC|nr:hypothetical protein [Nitrospirillum amazonense]MDG3444590.1 hypothetical protein [Nitrospirillum amazonense]